ncbi:MAG: N-acetyltransferase [Bacteroidales bacterium]|jgi:predicted GNAT family acetyltransferase|nr:N-acetyltransferase [Bacteroidales bacterium]
MEITHKNNLEQGFFLAEEDGVRMGYLSYEWVSDIAFAIMHTVVEPAFQGRGVARALLDAAVAFARENSYKIRPVCPYAEKVMGRDSSFTDVLCE